jgi:hypothetical protein
MNPPRLSKIYFNEVAAANDRAREIAKAKAHDDKLRRSGRQLALVEGMVIGFVVTFVFGLAALAALAFF